MPLPSLVAVWVAAPGSGVTGGGGGNQPKEDESCGGKRGQGEGRGRGSHPLPPWCLRPGQASLSRCAALLSGARALGGVRGGTGRAQAF